MTLRPCVECGEPTEESRCPEHALPSSPKASAHSRGYDAAWTKLSAKARRLQPWCSDCGATEDLQADHTPEAWARKARGKSIRLVDIAVVCGPCNRRRGAARPATTPANTPFPVTRGDAPARGPKDPGGKAKSALHSRVLAAARTPANTLTGTANHRAAS